MKLIDDKNALGMNRHAYYPRRVCSTLFDPLLSSGACWCFSPEAGKQRSINRL